MYAVPGARSAGRASYAARVYSLLGDDARVTDLERDLEAAREALGEYAADAMARLAAAERAADDASAARDRYARKFAAASQELKRMREDADGVERAKAVTGFVADAMSRSVEQLATMVASKAHRRTPEMTDVEEALSLLSDGLPEEIADVLWSLREPLLQRCRLVAAS